MQICFFLPHTNWYTLSFLSAQITLTQILAKIVLKCRLFEVKGKLTYVHLHLSCFLRRMQASPLQAQSHRVQTRSWSSQADWWPASCNKWCGRFDLEIKTWRGYIVIWVKRHKVETQLRILFRFWIRYKLVYRSRCLILYHCLIFFSYHFEKLICSFFCYLQSVSNHWWGRVYSFALSPIRNRKHIS